MSTSEHLRRKLSTFDDIVNTCPLLFRLHSCGLSQTFFDAERKVLLASRHAQKRKDSDEVSYDLKGLERKDPLLTLDNRDAVAEHVSTWAEGKTGPSDFISVTYNVHYVLWEWKRRRSNQLHWRNVPQDDYIVIVLESSKLRGRAKLGIEILGEDQEPAYRFAQFANEVIVADFIRSPIIVGTILMSQVEVFIPSWWEATCICGTGSTIRRERELNIQILFKWIDTPAQQGRMLPGSTSLCAGTDFPYSSARTARR